MIAGLVRPGELRDVARYQLDRAAQYRGAAVRWARPADDRPNGCTPAHAKARAFEAVAVARGARIVAEYAGAVLPW